MSYFAFPVDSLRLWGQLWLRKIFVDIKCSWRSTVCIRGHLAKNDSSVTGRVRITGSEDEWRRLLEDPNSVCVGCAVM